MKISALLAIPVLLAAGAFAGCSGGGDGATPDSGTPNPPADASMNPGMDSGGNPPPGRDSAVTPGDDGGATNCASLTTCGACAPVTGCGWCIRTNSCIPGTSPMGSTDMSCMGADWAYVPRQCPGFDAGPPPPPPNCAMTNTCGTCTPVDGCGWCRRTSMCIPGTSPMGSTDGTCMGADWAYIPPDCNTDGGVAGGG